MFKAELRMEFVGLMHVDMKDELNGILVVDKPAGMSSAQALSGVKKKTGASKAGHTGTLDPFATGVLVCCLNKATRLAPFLMSGRKIYEAELMLGIATDTQDATGKVVSHGNYRDITEERIQRIFQAYVGTIEQYPPVYSALKSNGVPLYQLARSGKPVQKPARKQIIYDNQILSIHIPFVRFRVTCSSGTYIRSLCADIGADLGCGGHLKNLRRMESGGFSIDRAISWPDLDQLDGTIGVREKMVGMSDALQFMPTFPADALLVEKIKHGRRLSYDDLPSDRQKNSNKESENGRLKIVSGGNTLLAVVKKAQAGDFFDYCCVLTGG